MSNETTIELIKKYQSDGDIDARNQVLLGNIRLIYKIAHRFRRSIENAFDDFVSEGIIGMAEAIDRFDTVKYKNFSTYACYYILKMVNLSVSMGTLHIPQHRIQIAIKYEKEKKAMLERGETPNLDVIAEKLKISERLLSDTIIKKDDISLDYVHTDDSNTKSFAASNDLAEEIATRLDFEKVEGLIEVLLSEQEQDVLMYRFGLNGGDSLTLHDISKIMNISPEYVRVLQNKSLHKLNRSLTKKW